MWSSITITIITDLRYFKSEVLYFSLLLLCKNYDNLAFLLGEFSNFSYAAGVSSNANSESITGWKQRLRTTRSAGLLIPFLYLLSFGRLRLSYRSAVDGRSIVSR